MTNHFKLQHSFTFKPVNSYWLTVMVSVIFAVVFNLRIEIAYIGSFPIIDFSRAVEAAAFLLFVFSLILIFFSIFSFPYLQKAAFITFFLTSASALYFSLRFNILFDESMLNNALETDFNEANDLLNRSFWLMFTLLGLLPSYIIFKLPLVYPKFWRNILVNLLSIIVAGAVIFITIAPYYAEFSSFVRNNNTKLSNSLLPYAPIHSMVKIIRRANATTSTDKKQIDSSAHINEVMTRNRQKPLALIVILGETARASSFERINQQLSGREGFLSAEANLVYFDNVSSCGTNTAASLPCMFSTYGKSDYQRSFKRKFENIAELIQRVGYRVTWRNNNSGCKGLCGQLINDPINHSNSADYTAYDHFFDEALVADLSKRVASSKKDQVFFLHQMGSHGPAYFKRTPENYQLLKPACGSKDFGKCTQQQIINAYDNSIIYTNHVIAKAIDELKKLQDDYDTALVYLSDHGESTGEGGYYLHGIPYFMAPEEQTHVPMLIWLSEGFRQYQKIDVNCLESNKSQSLSHDHFSHTLLGLLDIVTNDYIDSLDILYRCK